MLELEMLTQYKSAETKLSDAQIIVSTAAPITIQSIISCLKINCKIRDTSKIIAITKLQIYSTLEITISGSV